MKKGIGVIDETHLTLRSPRAYDDGGFESIERAMECAADLLYNGASEVAIVNAIYNPDEGIWYESGDGRGIYRLESRIDASNWEFDEENEEEH